MIGEIRIQKYRAFDKFFQRSKALFRAYEKVDKHSHDLTRTYAFCPVPGGWNGGQEKRLVQIFFGNRPYDSVTQLVSDDASGIPSRQLRLLTERGATLQYFREPSGQVTCVLIPARVEDRRSREDYVLLEKISDPAKLLRRSVTRRHWRYLISYMHCTGIDGTPNLFDHARTAWLRFTRTLIVKDEAKGPLIWKCLGIVVGFALTVGLSGFLLLLIPKPPTPEVSKVQIVQEPDGVTHARDAEMKRLDEIAATISSMSRDIDALKASASNPIAVKVIELPEKPKEPDAPPSAPKNPHKPKAQ